MNKYEVQEIIGEGTYGVVVKALNKETNEAVAIKKFKDNARNFIKRELKMLNSLKSCEFIINLKEAFRRNEKIFFIFEYVERTVLELLIEYPNGISQNICKSLTFQLCKAIEKCHSLDIVHRDIKPENLLIDRNYHLKLCDFGFARGSHLEENDCFTEYVATRWYRAPELLLVCPYGKPVDIWAIGCMVCEMTIGRPLFEGKSDLDQLQRIKSSFGQIGEFQLDELQRIGKQPNVKILKQQEMSEFAFEKKFSDMNEKLYDFTKRCLTVNPVERISIDECLNHPALEIQLKVWMNKSKQDITQTKILPRSDRLSIKTFKTVMMPREPSFKNNLTRSKTVMELKDDRSRHIASRLRQNDITPNQTGITDIKRNEVLFAKSSFPLLSNAERNHTSMEFKRHALSFNHEKHFSHSQQIPIVRENENLFESSSNNATNRRGEINRAATMISQYSKDHIFQPARSYQAELNNKEMKTRNYIKLLKNRHDTKSMKNRSQSTLETYNKTDQDMNESNGSSNLHNNQDLTGTFISPYQHTNTYNKFQREFINKSSLKEHKKTPESVISYRYSSKNIKVHPSQYLIQSRTLPKSDVMSGLSSKTSDDSYNIQTISNIKKPSMEKFTY